MPPDATTAGFAAGVARALRPGGLYAANLLDVPAYTFTDTQAAAARAEFADVCLIADDDFDRRAGQHNVVLAATTPGPLPLAGLARGLDRPPPGPADARHRSDRPVAAGRRPGGGPRSAKGRA